MIDDTAIDNHPPLYYLLLRIWYELGKNMGFAPGIFWLRLPGNLLWLFAVIFAWFFGRRILGASDAVLLSAVTGLAGQLAWSQHNVRGYALATPALIVCFLLLAWMIVSSSSQSRRLVWVTAWSGYAIAAAVALWSHLLSAFLLSLLGIWWLGSVIFLIKAQGPRSVCHPLVIGGFLAQVIAVLGFLPWIAEIRNQASNLQGPRRFWMTSLTLTEYLRVFAVWFPWGVEGARLPGSTPGSNPGAFQTIAGAFASLLPLGAAFLARFHSAKSASNPTFLILGFAGTFIAAAFVGILWMVDRAGWQHVFYAPRYTLFAAPLWGAGLAGFALYATSRTSRGSWFATLILLPWMLCGVLGHALLPPVEEDFALKKTSRDPAAAFPVPGSPLYVMPSGFIPIFKNSLAEYDVRPIDTLPDHGNESNAKILGIAAGTEVYPLKDRVISGWLNSGAIADNMEMITFPPHQESGTFYTQITLEGLRRDALEQMAREQYHPRVPPPSPSAIEVSLPGDWQKRGGWHALGVGPDLYALRWSRSERALIRFQRSLSLGKYIIRLSGFRTQFPSDTQTMNFWFSDTPGNRAQALVPAGPFDLHIDVVLEVPIEKPVLIISHPVFQLREMNPEANYEYPLGFMLYSAEILAAP